jgi:hypothetical protein
VHISPLFWAIEPAITLQNRQNLPSPSLIFAAIPKVRQAARATILRRSASDFHPGLVPGLFYWNLEKPLPWDFSRTLIAGNPKLTHAISIAYAIGRRPIHGAHGHLESFSRCPYVGADGIHFRF